MPLLNYTTTIEATKTVAQIQATLAKHGARAILLEYDGNGHIEALSFKAETPHGELGFKLPVSAETVLKVLIRQNVPYKYRNHAQAVRIAWRIVKDWIEAQMAILETEMVKMEQIFLPYMITPTGKTLYATMTDSKFLLQAGEEDNV